ncbi:MAG TPA: nucleotidyl transferase AbiEii/AbiGii toxin family protein [Anaeromyxobacteraceae bacterium]|nr:nucleotidyl transferase AbiEii/AbiGii toxin family protein [Anaeromyxobacteraceae bacterium]
MNGGRLTPVQLEVLRAVAGMVPAWRLAGGAALPGFHTRHRGTRDLDLFWLGKELGQLDAEILRRLGAAGFTGQVLQRDPAFCQLRVARGSDVVVVDLVADPVPAVADPAEHALGDVRILVDQPHEILVTKLCALLSRSEMRDLEDVRALLDAGGGLARALADAPRKEAGFSPVTLAWVLEQLPVAAMGRALGRTADEIRELEVFRQGLAGRILAAAKPA